MGRLLLVGADNRRVAQVRPGEPTRSARSATVTVGMAQGHLVHAPVMAGKGNVMIRPLGRSHPSNSYSERRADPDLQVLHSLLLIPIIRTSRDMTLAPDGNGIANGHVPQNGDGASNGPGSGAHRKRNL